jgi:hypothetical protein
MDAPACVCVCMRVCACVGALASDNVVRAGRNVYVDRSFSFL